MNLLNETHYAKTRCIVKYAKSIYADMLLLLRYQNDIINTNCSFIYIFLFFFKSGKLRKTLYMQKTLNPFESRCRYYVFNHKCIIKNTTLL